MKNVLVMLGLLLTACTPPAVEVLVYSSPSCGCCKKWIAHLEDNGFRVTNHAVQDVTPVKRAHGVTPALASCHTALVDGYVVEGHVPATEIRRLLKQRPAVKGLSVPGMPVGSPGMEQGERRDPYAVLSFTERGESEIFARY